MKILITAPSLDERENVSGISSVVRQIIAQSRFEFVHFTAGKKDSERKNFQWFQRQLFLARDLRRTLKAEKISAAHINTTLNTNAILRDAALVRACAKQKTPVILHIHGGKFLSEDFSSRFVKKLAEKMLRGAAKIIVLSNLEKKAVEQKFCSIECEVLENAVEIPSDKDLFKAEHNLIPNVIFLGRMHESKGLPELITACKTLKENALRFTLRAFGAGIEEKDFVAQMTKIFGTDFYFGGVVGGQNKTAELAKADIFVLPSRYGEGLPMALLEAMAHGKICIASEMASVGAVIENGVNGFLVEPRNVAQLVEKLCYAVENCRNLNDLRENARRTILENFNVRDYVGKLEKIYQTLFR